MKTPRITLVLLGTLLGLISCLPSSMIYPTVTPVPPVTHRVDNLIGIEPIWTLDDVYIISNEQDITLDSLMGKTCFLGDLGKRGLYKNFICLQSQSGKILWSKQNGVQRTITVTPEGIFIAYSSPAELKKFDLETGDLVWREKLDGPGSIHLTYLNNQVQVTTSSPTLWILDTDARLINKVKEGQKIVFLSTRDETYVSLNGLQALKTGTNEVLWEHIDMQRLRQAPIFAEDKLFLRNGVDILGTAYALDHTNGTVLWEVSDIIGNLAYSPDGQLVYALHEDGDLVAIDVNTGKETVIATFSPGPFIFHDGIDPCAYQLAYDADERILVVYLGDGRQLFAFKVE